MVAAITAASLCACSLDSEPARMCGSLALGPAQTRELEPVAGPVVAVSDGAGRITIVRACDGAGPPCEAELVSQTLPLNVVPDQLLLTASGRWLTYRVGPNLFRVDLERADPMPIGDLEGVHELVGSLRGGDWLIYRTWGEQVPGSIRDSELWAYYVGERPLDPDTGEPRPPEDFHFRIGAGANLDLRVAAMGHRHVVARRMLGNGEEELYLVRVAPAKFHDVHGRSELGKPLLLTRGERFTRVLITSGPSPAEHGDPWELQHEVPTDVRVIATSGEGPDARTLIYSVADASQTANFEGAVVSSAVALQEIAGLDPISPDGSHLAYITARGSLALRELESHENCMIRPATAAKHVLAGFGADGTLYFESFEGRDGGANNLVYAYDPASEAFTRLTSATSKTKWRLRAVPPRRYEDEDGRRIPWAVVAVDGFYAASPDHATPDSLNYDDVSFLPRDDDSLWLIEGEPSDGFDDPNRVTLRRVQPTSPAGDALVFDRETADPTVLDNGQLRERFTRTYPNRATVCVSTSQAASRTTPWATSCSTPERPTSYVDSGLPHGEFD